MYVLLQFQRSCLIFDFFFKTTGPICRHAEDLYSVLKILAGPDGKDPGCIDLPLQEIKQVSISELNVFVIEENGFLGVSEELKKVQRMAASHLEQCGAKIQYIRIQNLKNSLDIWSSMMAKQNTTPFGVLLGNGQSKNYFLELLKFCLGCKQFLNLTKI